MKYLMSAEWWKAAGIRAAKTMFQTGKAGTEGRNTCHDHCTADRHPVHRAAGHLCHNQGRAGLPELEKGDKA